MSSSDADMEQHEDVDPYADRKNQRPANAFEKFRNQDNSRESDCSSKKGDKKERRKQKQCHRK